MKRQDHPIYSTKMKGLALQKFIGVDFGVPRRAGDQARKTILIEAVKRAPNRYEIPPSGRNERLVRPIGNDWLSRRRGWVINELRDSLVADRAVDAAAFDFPFSIPVELLNDLRFAHRVGRATPFVTRAAWQSWVAENMPLSFDGDKATSRLVGLELFDVWRDHDFWVSRVTDKATKASPPLKDKFQAVFNMTIAGAALLKALAENGYQEKLIEVEQGRAVMETYPRAVAARLGFTGSYKQQPLACLETAIEGLAGRGIQLEIDPDVKNFCQTYTTGDQDHDGVDAFLCLVTAICFDQGQAEMCGEVVKEEGAIIVPKPLKACVLIPEP